MSHPPQISGSIPCKTNWNDLINASGSIPCVNPLGSPILSSFGGKVPNPTTQIKQFFASNTPCKPNTWVYNFNPISPNELLSLSPTIQSPFLNVDIPGDLTVHGSINYPSDKKLKTNINSLPMDELNKIMDISVKSFSFKDDLKNKIHYGIIAQEMENVFPSLVSEDKNNKYINYLELIPLLIGKIQIIQKELDYLKKIKK